MTDNKTISVELTTQPTQEYKFDLSIPETFAPEPNHVIDLPEGNVAKVYSYTWFKTTEGSRYEVQGWRIEFEGPYYNRHNSAASEKTKAEITQAHHVALYIKQEALSILADKRKQDNPDGEAKAPAEASIRHSKRAY